jgi:hypothetical protein
MRMTKEDVLAFKVGDQVHLLSGHGNATIVDRQEIQDEGGNVVGIELAFEFALENLIDRHVFTFDSDQPWVTEVRRGWRA